MKRITRIFILISFFIFIFISGICAGVFFEKHTNDYVVKSYEGGYEPMLRNTGNGWIPEGGCVPNAETALKIAKAVWAPIYGKKHLLLFRYKIMLVENIWYIEGYFRWFSFFGGGPFIKIDKNKGIILQVGHTA